MDSGRADEGNPQKSRRKVHPALADRSPFEQGLFGRMAEELPLDEFEAALKEWDEIRERRRRERPSPTD